ncbi:MAG TPA: putative toxin-antitoxin system toxin component, PIN family [Thermoleophilaceae bacterium]|nr:putative toxin-antitoxin system toxin component, PIN family [Thermoleophilaceae bacterium]
MATWPRLSPRCEGLALRDVLDSNVWVSGLIRPQGPPGRVLAALRSGAIEAVASWDLAEEIAEVLRRPKLARYGLSEEDVREALVLLAPLLPSVDVEVAVRDPDDAPVVASALAGGVEAIVTGDAHLLDDPDLRAWLEERGIDVISPADLLTILASR